MTLLSGGKYVDCVAPLPGFKLVPLFEDQQKCAKNGMMITVFSAQGALVGEYKIPPGHQWLPEADCEYTSTITVLPDSNDDQQKPTAAVLKTVKRKRTDDEPFSTMKRFSKAKMTAKKNTKMNLPGHTDKKLKSAARPLSTKNSKTDPSRLELKTALKVNSVAKKTRSIQSIRKVKRVLDKFLSRKR